MQKYRYAKKYLKYLNKKIKKLDLSNYSEDIYEYVSSRNCLHMFHFHKNFNYFDKHINQILRTYKYIYKNKTKN
jgi:hypothetical protein